MIAPVDVRGLVGHPGTSRRAVLSGPVQGLETEMARVPEGSEISLDILLESVVEGIYVTGSIRWRMRLSCSRCLRPVERDLEAEASEMFATEPAEDEYLLEGEELDLEPMVRDVIVLAMPFSPLCRPGCAGLCERCGGDRNQGECSCGPRVDPRWAALSDLKLD